MQIPSHRKLPKSLSSFFEVELIYSFEKTGVLRDVENENSVIEKLHLGYYNELKETEKYSPV